MQTEGATQRSAARGRKLHSPVEPVVPAVTVAVPLSARGEFSAHFGAATHAQFFTVDPHLRRITAAVTVHPPGIEPCGWADWLAARGVRVLLVGMMGFGARQRMAAAHIDVVAGVPPDLPGLLVQRWINRTLASGPNACDRDRDAGAQREALAGIDCCCPRRRYPPAPSLRNPFLR